MVVSSVLMNHTAPAVESFLASRRRSFLLQVKPDGCETNDSCGTWVAVPYFLIYMILAACVILNAIIMVVIAHFDTSTDPGKDIFEDLKKVQWCSCMRLVLERVMHPPPPIPLQH